jgi:glutamate synthase (NADPH) large chain
MPGLGFQEIEERIDRVHHKVFAENYMTPVYPLEIGGYYRDNPGFEYHDFNSWHVTQLHRFAENRTREEYLKFRSMIDNRGIKYVRDALGFKSPNSPLPIEQVEPVAAITRRFDSAAMSLGALSPKPTRPWPKP